MKTVKLWIIEHLGKEVEIQVDDNTTNEEIIAQAERSYKEEQKDYVLSADNFLDHEITLL